MVGWMEVKLLVAWDSIYPHVYLLDAGVVQCGRAELTTICRMGSGLRHLCGCKQWIQFQDQTLEPERAFTPEKVSKFSCSITSCYNIALLPLLYICWFFFPSGFHYLLLLQHNWQQRSFESFFKIIFWWIKLSLTRTDATFVGSALHHFCSNFYLIQSYMFLNDCLGMNKVLKLNYSHPSLMSVFTRHHKVLMRWRWKDNKPVKILSS